MRPLRSKVVALFDEDEGVGDPATLDVDFSPLLLVLLPCPRNPSPPSISYRQWVDKLFLARSIKCTSNGGLCMNILNREDSVLERRSVGCTLSVSQKVYS